MPQQLAATRSAPYTPKSISQFLLVAQLVEARIHDATVPSLSGLLSDVVRINENQEARTSVSSTGKATAIVVTRTELRAFGDIIRDAGNAQIAQSDIALDKSSVYALASLRGTVIYRCCCGCSCGCLGYSGFSGGCKDCAAGFGALAACSLDGRYPATQVRGAVGLRSSNFEAFSLALRICECHTRGVGVTLLGTFVQISDDGRAVQA